MQHSRLSFIVATAASVAALMTSCAAAARQDAASPTPPPPLFTEAEPKAVQAYWAEPSRYSVMPSPTVLDRVNVTVAGSTWFHGFNTRVAELRKADPAEAARWEDWFKRRAAFEKAQAAGPAAALPVLPAGAATPAAAPVPTAAPATDPGPIPPSLAAAHGTPPPLYEHVRPNRYVVTFAPEDAPEPFVYEDAIDFGRRPAYYGYYRHTNGVQKMGKRVRDYAGEDREKLAALFARAGKTPSEGRVMQVVSALEGGFEAINTYDTGHVSIGFIQFITAIRGDGSLAEVLSRHKADDPGDFDKTFRRFGIDVAPERVMVVVDPATGVEKRGQDAVEAIIEDKRLTAVFERAGGTDGFRVAQLSVARSRYWPGDDLISVVAVTRYERKAGEQGGTPVETTFAPAEFVPPGRAAEAAAAAPAVAATPPAVPTAGATPEAWTERKVLTARVGDVVRSEAGMATLMDRKVNRGNIRLINEVAANLMREKGLKRVEDLAQYEREVVAAMKYRHDFLADPILGQPK